MPAIIIYTPSHLRVHTLFTEHGYPYLDPFRFHALLAARLVPAHALDRFLGTVEDLILFHRGRYTKEGHLWCDFSGYGLPREALRVFNAHVQAMLELSDPVRIQKRPGR